jgi:hypothetical protein
VSRRTPRRPRDPGTGSATAKRAKATPPASRPARPQGAVAVDPGALAPYNSYGQPEFARRGYYVDAPFRCVDCGIEQTWTAAQQKWWYEVAKGYVYSVAKQCRGCRRIRQAPRKRHFEALAQTKDARARKAR